MVGKGEVIILGINGSPRKGATLKAIEHCLSAAASVPGITTRCIDLSGKKINCCINCNACRAGDGRGCKVFEDDFEDEYFDLMQQCHGLICATSIYSMNPTGLITNFFSRMRARGAFDHRAATAFRVGGSICVGGRRNGGQDFAAAAINTHLQSMGTNIVGGNVFFYNGAAIWSKNEKNFDDDVGLLEVEILGRKVAYFAKTIKAGIDSLGEGLSMANREGFHTDRQMNDALAYLGL